MLYHYYRLSSECFGYSCSALADNQVAYMYITGIVVCAFEKSKLIVNAVNWKVRYWTLFMQLEVFWQHVSNSRRVFIFWMAHRQNEKLRYSIMEDDATNKHFCKQKVNKIRLDNNVHHSRSKWFNFNFNLSVIRNQSYGTNLLVY